MSKKKRISSFKKGYLKAMKDISDDLDSRIRSKESYLVRRDFSPSGFGFSDECQYDLMIAYRVIRNRVIPRCIKLFEEWEEKLRS